MKKRPCPHEGCHLNVTGNCTRLICRYDKEQKQPILRFLHEALVFTYFVLSVIALIVWYSLFHIRFCTPGEH